MIGDHLKTLLTFELRDICFAQVEEELRGLGKEGAGALSQVVAVREEAAHQNNKFHLPLQALLELDKVQLWHNEIEEAMSDRSHFDDRGSPGCGLFGLCGASEDRSISWQNVNASQERSSGWDKARLPISMHPLSQRNNSSIGGQAQVPLLKWDSEDASCKAFGRLASRRTPMKSSGSSPALLSTHDSSMNRSEVNGLCEIKLLTRNGLPIESPRAD